MIVGISSGAVGVSFELEWFKCCNKLQVCLILQHTQDGESAIGAVKTLA